MLDSMICISSPEHARKDLASLTQQLALSRHHFQGDCTEECLETQVQILVKRGTPRLKNKPHQVTPLIPHQIGGEAEKTQARKSNRITIHLDEKPPSTTYGFPSSHPLISQPPLPTRNSLVGVELIRKARTHIIVTGGFSLCTPLDPGREDGGRVQTTRRRDVREREAGRSKPRSLLLWRRVSAVSRPRGEKRCPGTFSQSWVCRGDGRERHLCL